MVCTVCGIIAWVMGARDLKEMDAGRMDPSGRETTKAGKICGMIATILACVALGIALIILGSTLCLGSAAMYKGIKG